jgi:hypothetical protein
LRQGDLWGLVFDFDKKINIISLFDDVSRGNRRIQPGIYTENQFRVQPSIYAENQFRVQPGIYTENQFRVQPGIYAENQFRVQPGIYAENLIVAPKSPCCLKSPFHPESLLVPKFKPNPKDLLVSNSGFYWCTLSIFGYYIVIGYN